MSMIALQSFDFAQPDTSSHFSVKSKTLFSSDLKTLLSLGQQWLHSNLCPTITVHSFQDICAIDYGHSGTFHTYMCPPMCCKGHNSGGRWVIFRSILSWILPLMMFYVFFSSFYSGLGLMKVWIVGLVFWVHRQVTYSLGMQLKLGRRCQSSGWAFRDCCRTEVYMAL